MDNNKVRSMVLNKINEYFGEHVHIVSIEDIEECLSDEISTYGIELEDIENMILYEGNYNVKIEALNHDGINIEELGEE